MKKGFTFIELMIAVGTLGCIAAVVIPLVFANKNITDALHRKMISASTNLTKIVNIGISECRLSEVEYDGEKYIVLCYNGKMSICPKIKKEINDNK